MWVSTDKQITKAYNVLLEFLLYLKNAKQDPKPSRRHCCATMWADYRSSWLNEHNEQSEAWQIHVILDEKLAKWELLQITATQTVLKLNMPV